jgi:putative two-component system response regulator
LEDFSEYSDDKQELEEKPRKLKILCVDDTAFMLQTLSSILSDTYEVFSLTKGKLVERFLKNTTPDLFLLDYNMPEMNGFEVVPIIRSFEEHKDTPIIFLTALGNEDNVKTAVLLGACDFVVKPVNAEVLREKIAKHIVRDDD